MKELAENESLKSFLKSPAPGEIVKGKIIAKEKSAIFLALSNFGTGVISGKEFLRAKNALSGKNIGDEISAKVLKIENEDGFVELSIKEAKEEVAWADLKEVKEKDEIFEVKIEKANKGGLITEVKGIPAFIPVSQLSPEHYPKVEDGDSAEILKRLQKFIDNNLKVKIIGLDSKQKSVILSEKAATFKEKKEILENYKVGDVVKGKITGTTDFGAFIKFPANKKEEETLEGLIHISELDWQLVSDPKEIVKEGETVKAKIIEISNGRISLSKKALEKDPWQELKYKKGDIIKGTVTKFNPFGVFVKIESPDKTTIQGLCHISEFKNETDMKETLKIGEKYKFQISLIKLKEHKMILNLIREEK